MGESELSDIDELVEMESRTNGDGSVNVTIESWERNGGYVDVEFELIDSTTKETMQWPEAGGDLEGHKFYRLVKQADLSMRNADLLEGETARARKGDSGWELIVSGTSPKFNAIMLLFGGVLNCLKAVPWRHLIITAFWIVSVLALVWSITVIAA